MDGDQFFRDTVARAELHHEVATTAATGAGRKIGKRGDDFTTTGVAASGDARMEDVSSRPGTS